jgi:hypothetical protein
MALQLDQQRFIKLFAGSLSNPKEPQYCCKFYPGFLLFPLGWLGLVADPTDSEATGLKESVRVFNELQLAQLRKNSHNIFDVCMAFLTAERSKDAMKDLETRMNTCQCDLSSSPFVSTLHQWHWTNPTPVLPYAAERDLRTFPRSDTLEAMIFAMSELLAAAVGDNMERIMMGMQGAKRPTEKTWPSKPQSVLGVAA